MSTYPFHGSLHDTNFIPPSLDPATGVVSKDITIDHNNNVSARLFPPISTQPNKKKIPVLVYYHGGAFVGLSPFCPLFHNYLNSLVNQSNVLAVSVDYRLAPKYLDDSWAALKWVASHTSGKGPDPWLSQYDDFDRIFITGDSAGGNTCHQHALQIGTEGLGFGIDKTEGMVFVDPFFWGSKQSDEEEKALYYDLLWRIVNSSEVGLNLDHPWLNPFVDGAPNLEGKRCERVLVCVAGKDELVMRGKLYYETLKEGGWDGEVELVESEGKGHDFHLHEPECEQALELMKKLVAFLNKEDDGFFEGLFFRLFRLANVKPVKVADQIFKDSTPVQWVAADSCLFCCIELLLEHGFLGYKRLFP